MTSVLLAFDDVGTAVQLQESLEAAGYAVTWDATQSGGPSENDYSPPDVVLLVASSDGGLDEMVTSWRNADASPGILVMGSTDFERDAATELRVSYVPTTATTEELTGAIDQAMKLRFANGLESSSPIKVALSALGLSADGDENEVATKVIVGAREADIDLVREALRWHAHSYVAVDMNAIETLRTRRTLEIPEVEFAGFLDGTRTLQTLVKLGTLDAWRAARFIWALASIRALTLTPEPPDQSTKPRRAVAQARFHLQARQRRLARATFYDILEVTPDATIKEVDQAGRALAVRYSPKRIGDLDLATLAPLRESCWDQIKQAHATIGDENGRRRYNEWLSGHQHEVETQWLVGIIDARGAVDALSRGQKALVSGEIFKAVSDMASACRMHPHHPDYEASLAYAKYRADVQKGKDREETARRRRLEARQALAGHRPWPHALVALGLLCAAEDDADAARWHLDEALTCNPNLPAARQILQRLR